MAFGSPGRAAGRRSHRRPFTEINIVPFTDVVLVLLIIFMVTAQFIEHGESGLNLNLPSATQVESLDELGGIRVRVDARGQIAVNARPVTPEGLEAELRAVMQSPQQAVIIEGDRETVLQNVVSIMDAAMAVGLPNVVLATAAEGPETLAAGGADQLVPAAAPTEAAPQAPPAAEAPPAGDTPFLTPPPTR